MSDTPTKRDLELLDTLAFRVRVLSLSQVGATWWGRSVRPIRAATERLARLEDAGLTQRFSAMAHPQLSLDSPLATWHPGEPTPDLGKLAYRLQTRWTRPVIATSFVIVTRRGAALVGGHEGRRPRASETTHDLHLAAVYLLMRKRDPERARKWRAEACLFEQGFGRNAKLPDALVTEQGRGGRTAIEFGGAYKKEKLKDFHEYCEAESLAYELW